MSRSVNAAVLGAALAMSVALAPNTLKADDHGVVVYHDKHHHDDHHWNDRENRAYRVYWEGHHHTYREFNTLNSRDRDAYWNWRHHHSDRELKIDVY